MTYQETLDWMFAQLPMYQLKGPKALNAKLDKITSFSEHLGDPHKHFKSIHVAGTNGKGSSSHMLASILQEAGYKVGLYTSPHLKDFRERIKINGQTISEAFVVDFIAKYQAFLASNGLSFFEMTVGMAFYFFLENEVDIAIIEVGLGGRLDATNIVIPEVSLITNIGMDHTDLLGNTLEKITMEKAGIIKAEVPVVISEKQEEIAHLFEEVANERNAQIVFASEEDQKDFKTSLLGNYQKRNIKGVIATLKMLEGFEVNEEQIISGLASVEENTGLMGRWQVLQESPKVVCDTAHNSEGIALVLEQIAKQDFEILHVVLGFVEDKNLDLILPLFPKNSSYYFCRPDIRRGLDAGVLTAKAREQGFTGEQYSSVNEAFEAALTKATPLDFIYVGGSTFTVAEVL